MDERPFISIIVPTLNVEDYIGKCIQSFKMLSYPQDSYEVIVVDNESTDETVMIAKENKARVYKRKNLTISQSRNHGAAKAKGAILAFIDGDCTAPEEWLKDAIRLIDNETIGAVGAQYILPEESTWVERTWFLHIDKGRTEGVTRWLPSCNIIIKKEVFDKIGGFREDLTTNEDMDISKRIKDAGFRLYSHPDLSVVHLKNPKTVIEFLKKECWRGRGVWQNFLSQLPQVMINKALIFAIYTFLCFATMIIGLFTNILLAGYSLLALIVPSMTLAVQTIWKSAKWHYLLPLTFLYILYGMARFVSILDPRSWKFKKVAKK